MLQFRAHVENDKEVVAIELAATSKSQAGVMIMKSERCPIEAIKKLQRANHFYSRESRLV